MQSTRTATATMNDQRAAMNRQNLRFIVHHSSFIVLLFALIGCAQPARPASASLNTASWMFDGQAARVVKTDHYLIHTTIDDTEFLDSLAQVMEGSLEQYHQLTPGVQLSPRPMECYIFSRRPEW